MEKAADRGWDKVIRPRSGWFDVDPKEIWRYRDLVALFVWRDFVAVYKQTILGPLWYLIQPLLTTLVFTVIFGNVAKLPTEGIPPFLFYLSGVVAWRYFADCLNNTSNTFVANAHIFGKVYFPRIAVPVSVVISSLVSFGIQLVLFLLFIAYYRWSGVPVGLQPALALLPVLVLQMAALGLGFGIIVSAMTTRYRDLSHLVGFGVQLWMFATPVVYPSSSVPAQWRWLLDLNPMAPVVELFRHAFLGGAPVPLAGWLQSLAATAAVLLVGVLLFSRVEKTFMDTV
ncbi:ABC transporter permease [Geomonas subterranea]|uniref:Transport permease protein n=1 Tax=Geomonas subterranea TaxID=2847989 RepID=A0ABX8LLW8_9BACT|nr:MULTISPECIES: ABC transporter permease [Geomonas]QXE92336.1 ABC transporter permease [Geomonas subterranea]QXM09565.1 ABC transporter permease [Geomonas subterranea]